MRRCLMNRGLLLSLLMALSCLTLGAADKVLQVTSGSAGKALDFKVGDRFDITLVGNPTTGYNWEVAGGVDGVIEQSGKVEYHSQGTQPQPGGGGTFTFHFTAKSKGNTHLKLIYHRSFEKDKPPIETFELTVNVKPS
jgi:inhibitor of cysteine peptidase